MKLSGLYKSKKLTKHLIKSVFLFVSVALPSASFAVEQVKTLAGDIPGLTNTSDLPSFINALYNVAIMIGVILSIIMIAYSGLTYMTVDSTNDKTASKKRIRNALIGLLLLLGTTLILNMINPEITSLKILGK